MSKDPFQILADELTLIRKDMDQLQRTSLDKDEAKKLNQIVTGSSHENGEGSRGCAGGDSGCFGKQTATRLARSATQAATRAAESAHGRNPARPRQ